MIQSIRFQIGSALAGQFVFLAAVVGFTLYEIDLRKHDYAILNLTGQLRVISQIMVRDSNQYFQKNPANGLVPSDLSWYGADMDSLMAQYSEIIYAFKERKLTPELTGRDAPLYCNWDKHSKNQLDLTAESWMNFTNGIDKGWSLNPAPSNFRKMAQYILTNKASLIENSENLARAFQLMMEAKMSKIQFWLKASIAASVAIGFTVFWIIYFNAYKPLKITMAGFQRVSQGDLDFRIPLTSENEIGYISKLFNQVTERLSSIFQLTDKIHQAPDLDETLKFVHREFSSFLPIEWVGWLQKIPGTDSFHLDRIFSNLVINIREGEKFDASHGILNLVIMSAQPTTIITSMSLNHNDNSNSDFFRDTMESNGLLSYILLPQVFAGGNAVLVFASRQADSYDEQHIELLRNIGNLVTHSFEKTMGMESLVISALEGLAKLAESRDPETGDHLLRMSLYSAIIAEHLAKNVRYKNIINTAFIRNIFRFAPMHDIGKVGIEDAILLKPGKLTDEERNLMQKHPRIGSDVLRRCEAQMNQVGLSIFQTGIEIAEGHHEKYDGTGYPGALAGEKIPLSARIVSVADVFDALTSRRPYKEAWPIERACEYLHTESGRSFDPDIIEAFDLALPRILEVYEKNKHV